jgi:ribosomal protein S18 acetylase RimI-like enzyme
MVAAIALAGTVVAGSIVRRQDGIALVATGLPMLLFNQVMVEDAASASETAIEEAVAVMRARGHGFVVNLRVGSDDRFAALMARLGLAPLSERPWMPGMALAPIPSVAPTTGDGHEIRCITDPAGVEDHVRAAAAGFEAPESLMRSIVTPAILGDPRAALYAGYADGQPVSAGLGLRTGDTIGVYNIAVAPGYRRRGYGVAMTARVTADGAAAGADVAVLQASEMGYPVYERMGYRTVVEYMGYVEPGPVDHSAEV